MLLDQLVASFQVKEQCCWGLELIFVVEKPGLSLISLKESSERNEICLESFRFNSAGELKNETTKLPHMYLLSSQSDPTF